MLLWTTEFIIDNQEVWFVNGDIATLMRHNIKDEKTEILGILPVDYPIIKYNEHYMHKFNNKIYIVPASGICVVIYDICKQEFSRIEIEEPAHKMGVFSGICVLGNILYCIPITYHSIIEINMLNGSVIRYVRNWRSIVDDNGSEKELYCNQSCVIKNRYILMATVSDRLLVYDTKRYSLKVVRISNSEKISSIVSVGTTIIMYDEGSKRLMFGSTETFKINRIMRIPKDYGDVWLSKLGNIHAVVRSIKEHHITVIDELGNSVYIKDGNKDDVAHLKENAVYISRSSTDGKLDYIFDKSDCRMYSWSSSNKLIPVYQLILSEHDINKLHDMLLRRNITFYYENNCINLEQLPDQNKNMIYYNEISKHGKKIWKMVSEE